MNFIQMQQYIFLFLLDLKLWILAGAHLCKFKGAHTSRLWISHTVFTVYRTFDGTSGHGNSSTKPVAYQKLMNLMTNMRCFGCSLVGKGGLEFSGPAPKIPKTFSGTCSATFSGPRWTWLGFAPRLPGTFSRTFSGIFSGTLLNLTGCTEASQTFTGTFSRTLLQQSLPHLLRNLRNLLQNLVEPAPVHTGAVLTL